LDPRRIERLTRASRAAQALSETLWEALQEELVDPRRQRVAELSEQLGEIVAIVASLARADDGRAREAEAPAASVKPEETRVAAPMMDEAPSTMQQEQASAPDPLWGSAATAEAPSPAVLVDELAPTTLESPPVRTAPPLERPRPAHRPVAETRPREGDPPRKAKPQIEIRDERGGGGADGGPAAWIGSIGRRLERYGQDSSPFAVLLVELAGIERLRHAESPEELARLTNQVEDALTRGLRPADSLTRESPGRYWLLAPQTDVTGAQLLAERITRAVRASASHRGTPLAVAVGIAVCPDDGRQASELAAHADVGLYAARAAGRSSTR
jgi:GGDEF domain-containing protein